MCKWFTIVVLFWSSLVCADGAQISFGPSIDPGMVNQKLFKIGYEKDWSGLSLLTECGTWSDQKWVWLCDANLGVKAATTSGFYGRVGVGPAYLSHTDDRISTQFEFSLQGELGIQQGHWAVGAKFDHFSNAGIVQPNAGRDFLGAVIEYLF